MELKLNDMYHLFRNEFLGTITFNVNISYCCNNSISFYKYESFNNSESIIYFRNMNAGYYFIKIEPIVSNGMCTAVTECPFIQNGTIYCQKCDTIEFYIYLNETIKHDTFKSIRDSSLKNIIFRYHDYTEAYFPCDYASLIDEGDNLWIYLVIAIALFLVVMVIFTTVVCFLTKCFCFKQKETTNRKFFFS